MVATGLLVPVAHRSHPLLRARQGTAPHGRRRRRLRGWDRVCGQRRRHGPGPLGRGVINARYNTTNGLIRLAVAGQPCRNGEQAISWNQTGPAGMQGPQGAPGSRARPADGPAGPPGAPATLNPHQETRTLTIPEGGNYGGIFGGKVCSSGTLNSGGFQLLRDD